MSDKYEPKVGDRVRIIHEGRVLSGATRHSFDYRVDSGVIYHTRITDSSVEVLHEPPA